jgi:MoxR-like ATPase
MMKINIGYPLRSAEMEILRGGSKRSELYAIDPIMDGEEILRTQETIRREIFVSSKVLDYILNLVEATRSSDYFSAGLSTRGALALIDASKAHAYFVGKDFLVPEDIKEVAEFIIPHRVLVREEYDGVNKKEIVKSLLSELPTPV